MDKPIKAKVEAALFLTESPLKAQAVATMVGEDVNIVRQIILELIREYEERQGGLEVSDDNGYIIQVKDEFATLVNEFVPLEMPTSLIRTLSAIAIKQPVAQSEIIKIRGQGAYEHIKELTERELVSKKEDGRSPILTTTKKFQEYFRLSKDGKSLRQHLTDEDKESIEQAAAERATIPAIDTQGVFDASPDPDAEPIGMPAEVVSEQMVSEQADLVDSQEKDATNDESTTVSESESDVAGDQPQEEDGKAESQPSAPDGISIEPIPEASADQPVADDSDREVSLNSDKTEQREFFKANPANLDDVSAGAPSIDLT